jgi:hypothetical protein
MISYELGGNPRRPFEMKSVPPFFARQFCPSLSPSKTWSGVVGGIVAACVNATLFYRLSAYGLLGVGAQVL